MNDAVGTPKGKGRRMWDKYGSLVVLALVVIGSWNAATEWNASRTQAIIQTIIDSYDKRETLLRGRVRELVDRNQALAEQFGPTVLATESAANKAMEASENAQKAVDKADELIKVIPNVEDSTSRNPQQ